MCLCLRGHASPLHQSVGKETHRNVQLSSLRHFNEHPRLYFCASAVSGTSGSPPCWNLHTDANVLVTSNPLKDRADVTLEIHDSSLLLFTFPSLH